MQEGQEKDCLRLPALPAFLSGRFLPNSRRTSRLPTKASSLRGAAQPVRHLVRLRLRRAAVQATRKLRPTPRLLTSPAVAHFPGMFALLARAATSAGDVQIVRPFARLNSSSRHGLPSMRARLSQSCRTGFNSRNSFSMAHPPNAGPQIHDRPLRAIVPSGPIQVPTSWRRFGRPSAAPCPISLACSNTTRPIRVIDGPMTKVKESCTVSRSPPVGEPLQF